MIRVFISYISGLGNSIATKNKNIHTKMFSSLFYSCYSDVIDPCWSFIIPFCYVLRCMASYTLGLPSILISSNILIGVYSFTSHFCLLQVFACIKHFFKLFYCLECEVNEYTPGDTSCMVYQVQGDDGKTNAWPKTTYSLVINYMMSLFYIKTKAKSIRKYSHRLTTL